MEGSTQAQHSRRPGKHSSHLWVRLGQHCHTGRGQHRQIFIPGEHTLTLRRSDRHLVLRGSPKSDDWYCMRRISTAVVDSGVDSEGSRTGAGSWVDFEGSRIGAGSWVDSEGSWTGAESGVDSEDSRTGIGSEQQSLCCPPPSRHLLERGNQWRVLSLTRWGRWGWNSPCRWTLFDAMLSKHTTYPCCQEQLFYN